MPNDNVVPFQGSTEPPQPAGADAFDDLFSRLYVAVNQMQLIDAALESLLEENPRPHHAAAAFMVGEIATDLHAIYNELDQWHMRHTHQPKESAT